MKSYNKWNNLLGWLVFAISAAVYISTTEPSAGLWDCVEFYPTSYKLEIGHPPRAPEDGSRQYVAGAPAEVWGVGLA